MKNIMAGSGSSGNSISCTYLYINRTYETSSWPIKDEMNLDEWQGLADGDCWQNNQCWDATCKYI
jgi:hypothetical protein